MPVQRVNDPEQVQRDASPRKKSRNTPVSSWRHISCHMHMIIYYIDHSHKTEKACASNVSIPV
eukprot:2417607-Lingulodinium_polyedra.AAC.1